MLLRVYRVCLKSVHHIIYLNGTINESSRWKKSFHILLKWKRFFPKSDHQRKVIKIQLITRTTHSTHLLPHPDVALPWKIEKYKEKHNSWMISSKSRASIRLIWYTHPYENKIAYLFYFAIFICERWARRGFAALSNAKLHKTNMEPRSWNRPKETLKWIVKLICRYFY